MFEMTCNDMTCNMRNASCLRFITTNVSLTNQFAHNIMNPLTYCVPTYRDALVNTRHNAHTPSLRRIELT